MYYRIKLARHEKGRYAIQRRRGVFGRWETSSFTDDRARASSVLRACLDQPRAKAATRLLLEEIVLAALVGVTAGVVISALIG